MNEEKEWQVQRYGRIFYANKGSSVLNVSVGCLGLLKWHFILPLSLMEYRRENTQSCLLIFLMNSSTTLFYERKEELLIMERLWPQGQSFFFFLFFCFYKRESLMYDKEMINLATLNYTFFFTPNLLMCDTFSDQHIILFLILRDNNH